MWCDMTCGAIHYQSWYAHINPIQLRARECVSVFVREKERERERERERETYRACACARVVKGDSGCECFKEISSVRVGEGRC